MKTFEEFRSDTRECLNENPVLRAALGGAMMGGFPKPIVDTLKLMNRLPVKAPAIRAPYTPPPLKPSTPFRPGRSALGAAALSAITTKAADVLTKASNPKEWEKASAELRSRQSQPTPFQRFQQTQKTEPETGVGTKPRVAAPYTPPRPAAEPKVEPVKAKPKPAPVAAKPKPAPVAAKPKPKPVRKPEKPSPISTYKAHGSDLHVGRYKTLAQHRAAVAAQKNKQP